jgi:predicted NBD/HSP70 family sugar kinase
MTTSELAFSRHLNPRAIYDQLLDHQGLTRDQLAVRTGLTRVAASASVEQLVARGLAMPVAAQVSGGPASRQYTLMPTAGYVVAADIRHGNLTMAAADLTGALAAKVQLPFADPDDATALLQRAIRRVLDEAGADLERLRRVVLGSPGVIDPRSGEFAFATTLPTWKHTITADLRKSLGRPVVFENDVNLAAMAEARFGCGARDLVFALFGEGLGVGMVLNGHLRRGRHGWAGEIGFLPAPPPQPPAEVSGMRDSVHQLASAPAIGALAQAHGLGTDPTAAVVAALEAGPAGAAFLDEVARRLAVVVSHACLLIDPAVMVIDGGYVCAGGERLLELVRREIATISPTPVRLSLPAVRDDPILRGALQTALEDARDSLFAA